MLNGFKVIDAHCHIYPEKIAEKAVAGTDRFYDTVAKCKGTVSDLFYEGDKAGVDRFIVQSVATTPKQVKSINEFIASEVAENSARLTGLGTLHPESDDIVGDVAHLLELGLHGVKLHPDIQRFKIDDYRCLKIYELCEREGLPILMHTGDSRYDFSNPNRLVPVLKIYTGLTVVGAHFGGWSIWEKASKELCELSNLYVDCSSSFYYIPVEKGDEIIKRYGVERVMFGTDYPMWNPKEELETFFRLKLTDAERQAILYDNAEKVYINNR